MWLGHGKGLGKKSLLVEAPRVATVWDGLGGQDLAGVWILPLLHQAMCAAPLSWGLCVMEGTVPSSSWVWKLALLPPYSRTVRMGICGWQHHLATLIALEIFFMAAPQGFS